MRAMVLQEAGQALVAQDLPTPTVRPGHVLLKVLACGVCRTDLHVVDGELENPKLPLTPGHQVVGEVVQAGPGVKLQWGERVGVPWLGWTCGECRSCAEGRENLCEKAQFTGYQRPGGFAEYCEADARFCFPIPKQFPDRQAAPLLCAGLVGYRALRMTGSARTLGFYGFGAAAHILVQVARHQDRQVYAFTRPGDEAAQKFATDLGATWAGDSETEPPVPLDAAILFAPDGSLVPKALRAVRPGGRVICAGIHMSDIPSFPYKDLWGERSLMSVANLTRQDGVEFMNLASTAQIETEITAYALEDVNQALADLRDGRLTGAAVVVPGAVDDDG